MFVQNLLTLGFFQKYCIWESNGLSVYHHFLHWNCNLGVCRCSGQRMVDFSCNSKVERQRFEKSWPPACTMLLGLWQPPEICWKNMEVPEVMGVRHGSVIHLDRKPSIRNRPAIGVLPFMETPKCLRSCKHALLVQSYFIKRRWIGCFAADFSGRHGSQASGDEPQGDHRLPDVPQMLA